MYRVHNETVNLKQHSTCEKKFKLNKLEVKAKVIL